MITKTNKPKVSTVLDVYGQSGLTVYDSFMVNYFSLLDQDTLEAHDNFYKQLDLQAGQKLLEVGFGTGSNMRYYPVDVELVGLDLTLEMLEKAKIKARELGREGVEFIVGNGSNIPYEDESFDVVVSTYNLCVAEGPERVLSEMIRVCRSGGVVGIIDYKKANENPRVLKDQKFLADTMKTAGLYHEGKPAVVFDVLSDLDALVEKCGLEILHQEKIERSFTECVGIYVMRK